MSTLASKILLGGALVARARGDTAAALTTPFANTSTVEAWLEEALGEAFGEAFLTFAICLGVWACGRSLGFKFGGASKSPKTAKQGLQGPRLASAPKPPKQAALVPAKATPRSLDPCSIERPSSPPAPLRSGPPRQGRGGVATEADALAAAIKAGRAAELPRLLDASLARLTRAPAADSTSEQGADPIEALVVASLRACAAKRSFADALALYSHVQDRIARACGSTWSLLLWSAVEAGRFELCAHFIEKLVQSGAATSHDFVNITRYYVHAGGQEEFAPVVERISRSGGQIDVIARNRALSLCTNARRFGLARKVVECVPEVPMDAIAHNTLMKAYASMGDLPSCFGQYTEMTRAQIDPTEMTFGILLDACIDGKQMDLARRVFADLRESGLSMNVILYTTYLKGLVSAGDLTEAMEILDEMCENGTAKPDLVTFSTIVKAHASVGDVMECVRLLERMFKMRVEPDAVLYNTVLTGCCHKAMEPAQISHVFSWLLGKGLQPSTATVSVLIKAFSLSQAWSHALDMLEAAPARYGIWPEARVYGQLAQGCAKDGCGRDAVASYIAMVRAAGKQGVAVERASRARLQRACAQSGQGPRAARITQALQESDGHVDRRVLDVLEAAA